MVAADNYQTIISNAIDTYGSTITITPITITTNTRGDDTESAGTPVVTVAVPFNYFDFMYAFQKFKANMNQGEVSIIIKDSETIDEEDKITYNSKDYSIREIQPFEIQDVVLAKQLLLRERA